MRLCKNGEWQEVIVDDYFPCYPNGGPIFSKCGLNEMWVLLLEKAYAKLHGGYKNLTGGAPFEGLADLTGCPTTSFNLKDDKVRHMIDSGKFWDLVTHFQDECYLLTGSTAPQDMWTEQGTPAPGMDRGMMPGHSYTVLQAKEAKGQKLIQLRSPFGRLNWRGDWSAQSPQWT